MREILVDRKLYEQWAFRKLSALWELSRRLGYLDPERELEPELRKIAPVYCLLALLVLARKESTDVERTACGMILTLLWPQWRECCREELVGASISKDDVLAGKWRKAILERDGYRCTKCGTRRHLEAHHIVPWAVAPHSRISLSNGLTLCSTHHKVAHAIRVRRP